ncbi:MAG: 50S ribosomal protein L15 [Candidatus Cloacimonetes bacterium]|nr:50S ribosomal protein L15 [Candidatus Cloacimonadota bacterium]
MLHELKRPAANKKNKKRLGKGEGTGQGCTAGRGNKGQKSRSGGNIPLWFEGGQMPIQRRLPKRGFKNIFRVEYRVVNLGRLNELDTDTLDIPMMVELGLINKVGRNRKAPVKILANGADNFDKKVHIKANAFSKAAREIIEKCGGKAEVV